MFSEKLNVFLDDYSKNNNFFGLVRVTLKDRVIFQKNIGYADYEKAIPFYADSMFTFYSLSKPFLSIGISWNRVGFYSCHITICFLSAVLCSKYRK